MCKFQPHRYSFQSKLFDTPICILLTLLLGYILLKLFSYTIQTVSVPPAPPPPNPKILNHSEFPKLFLNCLNTPQSVFVPKILILTKLF